MVNITQAGIYYPRLSNESVQLSVSANFTNR